MAVDRTTIAALRKAIDPETRTGSMASSNHLPRQSRDPHRRPCPPGRQTHDDNLLLATLRRRFEGVSDGM